jgi:hypothetical protein
MRKHMILKEKPCPVLSNEIELTEDIINHVLANRVYRPQGIDKEVKQLRVENAILRNRKNEDVYQYILEQHLQGCHKHLSCGFTDITTDTLHAEIKSWKQWKHAMGQILAYGRVDPRNELHIYLYGQELSPRKRNEAVETLKSLNIKPFQIDILNPEQYMITNLLNNSMDVHTIQS